MPFFAVCYAHVVRYEKAGDESEATKLAFGVELDKRLTVARLPKSPKSMSYKAKIQFLGQLAVQHFRRTGNVLEGWKDQPGIKNVHRSECPTCEKPILTEPASAGVDRKLCSECDGDYYEPKVDLDL